MGMIYVFTGDGKGKTSAALGVALRSSGYKKHGIKKFPFILSMVLSGLIITFMHASWDSKLMQSSQFKYFSRFVFETANMGPASITVGILIEYLIFLVVLYLFFRGVFSRIIKEKITIVQFMKKRKTGEVLFSKETNAFEIYQFGKKGFVNLKRPSKTDIKEAEKALAFSEKLITENPPNLLILDEINVAIKYKLLNINKVLEFIEKIPEKTNVILTGRYAPKKILNKVDLVTEMKEIKHPYAKGTGAKKGLDF